MPSFTGRGSVGRAVDARDSLSCEYDLRVRGWKSSPEDGDGLVACAHRSRRGRVGGIIRRAGVVLRSWTGFGADAPFPRPALVRGRIRLANLPRRFQKIAREREIDMQA